MIDNIAVDLRSMGVVTQPKAAINVATMTLMATMPPTHLLGGKDQNGPRVRVIIRVSIAE